MVMGQVRGPGRQAMAREGGEAAVSNQPNHFFLPRYITIF